MLVSGLFSSLPSPLHSQIPLSSLSPAPLYGLPHGPHSPLSWIASMLSSFMSTASTLPPSHILCLLLAPLFQNLSSEFAFFDIKAYLSTAFYPSFSHQREVIHLNKHSERDEHS